MFQCERDGEVRSFEEFYECEEYVLKRAMYNELWAYLGEAKRIYENKMEAAYEAWCETDRPSFREQYVSAWEEKRRLHS